jgi:hypothetical protein
VKQAHEYRAQDQVKAQLEHGQELAAAGIPNLPKNDKIRVIPNLPKNDKIRVIRRETEMPKK